jgi:hypothetical protein
MGQVVSHLQLMKHSRRNVLRLAADSIALPTAQHVARA